MVTTEYDEHGEYTVMECDGCERQADTLYVDGNKHYCLRCYLRRYKEDFIKTYMEEIVEDFWDDIVEGWGTRYVDGCEKIEIEE